MTKGRKMERLCLNFLLSIVFISSLHISSFADEVDDAKAVLIESVYNLSGEGAVISGPVFLEEIEKDSLKKILECKHCPQVPFGFDNRRWGKFKSQYKTGDVIFYFHTNSKSWADPCGREGYALIRGKKIIDTILTKMN